jgi:hypothetical protein
MVRESGNPDLKSTQFSGMTGRVLVSEEIANLQIKAMAHEHSYNVSNLSKMRVCVLIFVARAMGVVVCVWVRAGRERIFIKVKVIAIINQKASLASEFDG